MERKETQALYIRIPTELNNRIDAEVFRRKCRVVGRRLSRREVVTELLHNGLARLESGTSEAAKQ